MQIPIKKMPIVDLSDSNSWAHEEDSGLFSWDKYKNMIKGRDGDL